MLVTIPVALQALALLWLCAGEVRAGGENQLFTDTVIQQDMTWSGVVEVRGVFVVGRGATLTIRPGTTVLFHRIDTNSDGIGDSEIRVLGRLVAEGTPEAPIVFRSAEKTPAPKDWSYVLIFASARRSQVRYCLFRDAFTGLQVHFSSAEVSDSAFVHNNEGIRFGRAKLRFTNNLVRNNTIGVRFTRMEGPVEITGNVITANRIGVFLVPSSQNIVDFFEPGRTGKPWNEGHLLIEGNNIHGNEDYDLNLGAKQKWDLAAAGNWWGVTDPDRIRKKIFDKSRDEALGRAIIEPVREAPARNAGPRSAGIFQVE
ncbi:MAG: hypothetical protein Kow0089_19470 [Desulfobulbaceae bacterium]